MRETTPRNQRIYLRFEDAGMGMMRLAASLTPPAYKEPVLVLLSRGVMPLGQPVSLLLISDPTQNEALRGNPGDQGLSAYQLARQQGYGEHRRNGSLRSWARRARARTSRLAIPVTAEPRRSGWQA